MADPLHKARLECHSPPYYLSQSANEDAAHVSNLGLHGYLSISVSFIDGSLRRKLTSRQDLWYPLPVFDHYSLTVRPRTPLRAIHVRVHIRKYWSRIPWCRQWCISRYDNCCKIHELFLCRPACHINPKDRRSNADTRDAFSFSSGWHADCSI